MNLNKKQEDPTSEITLEEDKQYSLSKIVGIWALATAPMTVLGYFGTPMIIRWFNIPKDVPVFLVFWPLMIIGMVWLFVLSLIIVYRENGSIKWQTIKKRMWYNTPRDPKTGKSNKWLFLWVIPFMAISIVFMFFIPLPDIVGSIFPFLKSLPQFNLGPLMTPEYKGVWWLLGLILITIPFNYLLGEEFLFRGILLPKMKGVFGKWDWFFNGVFFAFYHLHKPLGILNQIVFSGFLLSYPSRRFRSNWMAVIIHGMEGLIALVIVLGIILGST